MESTPKFRKRKENSLSCLNILHKTCHQEISRPSHAVTSKKCTKKCSACAELLFNGYKPCCYFDVLIAVAVALLKIPKLYTSEP